MSVCRDMKRRRQGFGSEKSSLSGSPNMPSKTRTPGDRKPAAPVNSPTMGGVSLVAIP